MTVVSQPSFTGGELKPSLHSRVDIAKYGVSLMVLRNYIIHAGGGTSNRGGLRTIIKQKYDDRNSVLIPFQYSTEQNYMLEFGDFYMRVYKDGGIVLNNPKDIEGITKSNPAFIDCTAHGFSVGNWVYISAVGGMRQINGRFFIVTSTTSDTFTVSDLFGTTLDSSNFDLYVSGGKVASVYEMVTPYAHADLMSAYEIKAVSPEKIGLVYTQSANVMTLTHENYDPMELTRSAHNAWSISAPTFAPSIDAPLSVVTSGPAATGGTSTIKYIITSVAANGEESLASVANVITVAKNPNTWVASDYIDIDWAVEPDAVKYNVYKDKNGYYGFIGFASSNEFRDDNIEPVANDGIPEARNPFSGAGNKAGAVTLHDQRVVYARTKNKPDTVFTTQTANYHNMNVSVPAKDTDAVTYTIASEQVNAIKYLMSIGDLIAFTGNAEWKLTGSDDTAISPSSVGAWKQSARGIAPVPPLLIGSTALLVQARGKKVRDFKYTLEGDGYDGNDISILSSHLFRKTRTVDKRLISWCYQQEPDSIVWGCHLDGSATSLTYQREHEVWGYARHDTDGKFINTASMPEGDSDGVYFTIQRTVNGVNRKFTERMETRDVDEDDLIGSFFVDAGVQIFGNGSTEIYGLEHLQGKSVTVLADGNVVTPVQGIGPDGKIVLDKVYGTVCIGLLYDSDIQPLDIETNYRDGSSTKGSNKRIPRVFVDVYNSRDIWAGRDADHLKQGRGERTDELMGEPTRLQTRRYAIEIGADWKNGASVFIRHSAPLPITILAISPDVDM